MKILFFACSFDLLVDSDTKTITSFSANEYNPMKVATDDHGYVKMAQPRKANGKKYLVGEVGFVITKEQLDAGVFITLANHCTCAVRGGYIKDIWDCRYKTIGNYYVKSTANGSGAKYGSGEAVDSKRRFII